MIDALFIAASVALVAVALAWFRAWPAALADLLWMIPMRPGVVGFVAILVSGAMLVLMSWAPVEHLTAVRFLVVLGLGPLVVRPLADFVAYRRDKAQGGSRHYVFRWKLRRLETSYRKATGSDSSASL